MNEEQHQILMDLFETHFERSKLNYKWDYQDDNTTDLYLNLVLYGSQITNLISPNKNSSTILNEIGNREVNPPKLSEKVKSLINLKVESLIKRQINLKPGIYVNIFRFIPQTDIKTKEFGTYYNMTNRCLYFKYVDYEDLVRPRQKNIEEAIVPFIESIRINGEIFSAKWYIDIHGSKDYIDLDLALYDRYFDQYFEKIKKPGDKSIALDGVVPTGEDFTAGHKHKGVAAKFGPGVAAGVASFVADAVENKYEKQIRVNIYNCKEENSVLLFSFLIPKTTQKSTVQSTTKSRWRLGLTRGGKSGDSSWIAHVRRVQEQANKSKARKNKPMTWNEAMKAASKTYKKR